MLERRVEHDAGREGVGLLGLEVGIAAADPVHPAQDVVVRRQQRRGHTLREAQCLDLRAIGASALRARHAARVRRDDQELAGDLGVIQLLDARRAHGVLERAAPQQRTALTERDFGFVGIGAARLFVLRVAIADVEFDRASAGRIAQQRHEELDVQVGVGLVAGTGRAGTESRHVRPRANHAGHRRQEHLEHRVRHVLELVALVEHAESGP